ncbi:hypothetical protein JCGZ_24605 [Jatropha curcas]|uniref:Uncharacterized protein n=1 Tax=Jatropha curcas TaxID=180498 RepID=A0A067KWL7_JATCU|nr:uncharacterized protein LOC105631299 [Jatropha curcas]KDP40606.1 hypothetical protein JCGZ_24605 [Jatropha curcas]
MAGELKFQAYDKYCETTKPSSSRRRKGRHGFTTKCASLIKEQRSRIYILRRCATMLLCWYIHGDD